MSDSKTIAEHALRCLNMLRDLTVHDKGAVIGIMNILLGAELRRQEEQARQASPLNAQMQAFPADERIQ